MKRTLVFLLAIIPGLLHAQPKMKNKKYQGLLWEITGNGLKKPSYLFGTMHVSSKLAFHLADSFYLGIRNADMVALETNPESWQEDMSKYDLTADDDGYRAGYNVGGYTEEPNEFLRISTLKFYKYDKKIESALYSNPSTINNLLYRSYGNESSDFEEDTYLDMYIYQCGKRWGKRVAGVEQYGESMRLMSEAYKDAAKDKNRKDRSNNDEEGYSATKLQEAYRSGNLDWLDSINKYNSFSAAFDEKFMYRRNEIQASSIDTILRSGLSLFVGVGAAHLPGNRGVIEMLRTMGYKLRPVKMGARDSQHKTEVEKLRVPVQFTTQSVAGGLYKVDIPGKFYKFGEDNGTDQQQYADMANGSYYMVTRIMTNAWMWGHSEERVRKVIDSLLYENIPGKIISKTSVVRNGYKGIELTNKTRRGDIQRYAIYTTPFEIVIFKMSGTGDYVLTGEEAKRFFGSIQFKEYKPVTAPTAWKKFAPKTGGFSIDMPHEPYVGNDGSWIFDAEDKSANAQYRVIRSDVHNYRFVEEDTFDLGLMDESFAASEFIDKKISRKQTTFKGYPALDCKYRDKSGSIYTTRYIIQGPHYYTLIAHGKNETPAMDNFLNSFQLQPFIYSTTRLRRDTSLFYSVMSPVFPEAGKQKLDMPRNMYYGNEGDEEGSDVMAGGMYRSKVIENDTTGEKIYVGFFKSPRYAFLEDSSALESDNGIGDDTTWIVKSKKKYELPNKMKVWERVVTDTGSSRTIRTKSFYKDGVGFVLLTQADTLTPPSDFVKSFFDTFDPVDSLKSADPFKRKSDEFFEDFHSSDSVVHKRAVRGMYMVKLDSSDFLRLKQTIASLSWKEKSYLDVKKALIGKLNDVNSKQSSDYLRELYYAAGDTIELQYTALEILLKQRSKYAYQVFRDIMVQEPPILNISGKNKSAWSNEYVDVADDMRQSSEYRNYSDGNFLNDLHDSLALTRTILTDLLPLMNLDDYEQPVTRLLARMVDSNLVKPADYQPYFNKFLIETKQELKRQAIIEKQKAIVKAEQTKDNKAEQNYSLPYGRSDNEDNGNDDLELYATILLPAWESNPQVKPLFQQLLSSGDKKLRYRVMMLLLRNGKPFPDSLLRSFAKLDDYRYALYKDLKKIGQSDRFPKQYNTHLDLAKSKLMAEKSYARPDTIAYIDRIATEIKGRKGYVYFFKYKAKNDDPTWRLASVGLVPQDTNKFEFEKDRTTRRIRSMEDYTYDEYDFTGFLETKLKDDEPVLNQLNKRLRFMLYSKRKSAKNFYDNSDNDDDTDDVTEVVPVEN